MKAELKLVLLSAVFSAACTAPLKSEAPEGWPRLEIIERVDVAQGEVSAACDTEDPILACSRINLCDRTCTQSYTPGSRTPEIKEHEDGHCAGRDHWFSSVLADLLARWKRGEECRGQVTKKDHDNADAAFLLLLLL